MYSCEMHKLKIYAKEHLLYSYRMDEQIFQTILAFFLIIYVFQTSCSYFEVTLSLPVQYFSTGNQNALVAAVCELEPLGTLLTVVLGACRGLQLVTA